MPKLKNLQFRITIKDSREEKGKSVIREFFDTNNKVTQSVQTELSTLISIEVNKKAPDSKSLNSFTAEPKKSDFFKNRAKNNSVVILDNLVKTSSDLDVVDSIPERELGERGAELLEALAKIGIETQLQVQQKAIELAASPPDTKKASSNANVTMETPLLHSIDTFIEKLKLSSSTAQEIKENVLKNVNICLLRADKPITKFLCVLDQFKQNELDVIIPTLLEKYAPPEDKGKNKTTDLTKLEQYLVTKLNSPSASETQKQIQELTYGLNLLKKLPPKSAKKPPINHTLTSKEEAEHHALKDMFTKFFPQKENLILTKLKKQLPTPPPSKPAARPHVTKPSAGRVVPDTKAKSHYILITINETIDARLKTPEGKELDEVKELRTMLLNHSGQIADSFVKNTKPSDAAAVQKAMGNLIDNLQNAKQRKPLNKILSSYGVHLDGVSSGKVLVENLLRHKTAKNPILKTILSANRGQPWADTITQFASTKKISNQLKEYFSNIEKFNTETAVRKARQLQPEEKKIAGDAKLQIHLTVDQTRIKEIKDTEVSFYKGLGLLKNENRFGIAIHHLPDDKSKTANTHLINFISKSFLKLSEDSSPLLQLNNFTVNEVIRIFNSNEFKTSLNNISSAIENYFYLSLSTEFYNKMTTSDFETEIAIPRGEGLASILITPVQRLPRYELLITELINKATLNEKPQLQHTLKNIKKHSAQINETGHLPLQTVSTNFYNYLKSEMKNQKLHTNEDKLLPTQNKLLALYENLKNIETTTAVNFKRDIKKFFEHMYGKKALIGKFNVKKSLNVKFIQQELAKEKMIANTIKSIITSANEAKGSNEGELKSAKEGLIKFIDNNSFLLNRLAQKIVSLDSSNTRSGEFFKKKLILILNELSSNTPEKGIRYINEILPEEKGKLIDILKESLKNNPLSPLVAQLLPETRAEQVIKEVAERKQAAKAEAEEKFKNFDLTKLKNEVDRFIDSLEEIEKENKQIEFSGEFLITVKWPADNLQRDLEPKSPLTSFEEAKKRFSEIQQALVKFKSKFAELFPEAASEVKKAPRRARSAEQHLPRKPHRGMPRARSHGADLEPIAHPEVKSAVVTQAAIKARKAQQRRVLSAEAHIKPKKIIHQRSHMQTQRERKNRNLTDFQNELRKWLKDELNETEIHITDEVISQMQGPISLPYGRSGFDSEAVQRILIRQLKHAIQQRIKDFISRTGLQGTAKGFYSKILQDKGDIFFINALLHIRTKKSLNQLVSHIGKKEGHPFQDTKLILGHYEPLKFYGSILNFFKALGFNNNDKKPDHDLELVQEIISASKAEKRKQYKVEEFQKLFDAKNKLDKAVESTLKFAKQLTNALKNLSPTQRSVHISQLEAHANDLKKEYQHTFTHFSEDLINTINTLSIMLEETINLKNQTINRIDFIDSGTTHPLKKSLVKYNSDLLMEINLARKENSTPEIKPIPEKVETLAPPPHAPSLEEETPQPGPDTEGKAASEDMKSEEKEHSVQEAKERKQPSLRQDDASGEEQLDISVSGGETSGEISFDEDKTEKTIVIEPSAEEKAEAPASVPETKAAPAEHGTTTSETKTQDAQTEPAAEAPEIKTQEVKTEASETTAAASEPPKAAAPEEPAVEAKAAATDVKTSTADEKTPASTEPQVEPSVSSQESKTAAPAEPTVDAKAPATDVKTSTADEKTPASTEPQVESPASSQKSKTEEKQEEKTQEATATAPEAKAATAEPATTASGTKTQEVKTASPETKADASEPSKTTSTPESAAETKESLTEEKAAPATEPQVEPSVSSQESKTEEKPEEKTQQAATALPETKAATAGPATSPATESKTSDEKIVEAKTAELETPTSEAKTQEASLGETVAHNLIDKIQEDVNRDIKPNATPFKVSGDITKSIIKLLTDHQTLLSALKNPASSEVSVEQSTELLKPYFQSKVTADNFTKELQDKYKVKMVLVTPFNSAAKNVIENLKKEIDHYLSPTPTRIVDTAEQFVINNQGTLLILEGNITAQGQTLSAFFSELKMTDSTQIAIALMNTNPANPESKKLTQDEANALAENLKTNQRLMHALVDLSKKGIRNIIAGTPGVSSNQSPGAEEAKKPNLIPSAAETPPAAKADSSESVSLAPTPAVSASDVSISQTPSSSELSSAGLESKKEEIQSFDYDLLTYDKAIDKFIEMVMYAASLEKKRLPDIRIWKHLGPPNIDQVETHVSEYKFKIDVLTGHFIGKVMGKVSAENFKDLIEFFRRTSNLKDEKEEEEFKKHNVVAFLIYQYYEEIDKLITEAESKVNALKEKFLSQNDEAKKSESGLMETQSEFYEDPELKPSDINIKTMPDAAQPPAEGKSEEKKSGEDEKPDEEKNKQAGEKDSPPSMKIEDFDSELKRAKVSLETPPNEPIVPKTAEEQPIAEPPAEVKSEGKESGEEKKEEAPKDKPAGEQPAAEPATEAKSDEKKEQLDEKGRRLSIKDLKLEDIEPEIKHDEKKINSDQPVSPKTANATELTAEAKFQEEENKNEAAEEQPADPAVEAKSEDKKSGEEKKEEAPKDKPAGEQPAADPAAEAKSEDEKAGEDKKKEAKQGETNEKKEPVEQDIGEPEPPAPQPNADEKEPSRKRKAEDDKPAEEKRKRKKALESEGDDDEEKSAEESRSYSTSRSASLSSSRSSEGKEDEDEDEDLNAKDIIERAKRVYTRYNESILPSALYTFFQVSGVAAQQHRNRYDQLKDIREILQKELKELDALTSFQLGDSEEQLKKDKTKITSDLLESIRKLEDKINLIDKKYRLFQKDEFVEGELVLPSSTPQKPAIFKLNGRSYEEVLSQALKGETAQINKKYVPPSQETLDPLLAISSPVDAEDTAYIQEFWTENIDSNHFRVNSVPFETPESAEELVKKDVEKSLLNSGIDEAKITEQLIKNQLPDLDKRVNEKIEENTVKWVERIKDGQFISELHQCPPDVKLEKVFEKAIMDNPDLLRKAHLQPNELGALLKLMADNIHGNINEKSIEKFLKNAREHHHFTKRSRIPAPLNPAKLADWARGLTNINEAASALANAYQNSIVSQKDKIRNAIIPIVNSYLALRRQECKAVNGDYKIPPIFINKADSPEMVKQVMLFCGYLNDNLPEGERFKVINNSRYPDITPESESIKKEKDEFKNKLDDEIQKIRQDSTYSSPLRYLINQLPKEAGELTRKNSTPALRAEVSRYRIAPSTQKLDKQSQKDLAELKNPSELKEEKPRPRR